MDFKDFELIYSKNRCVIKDKDGIKAKLCSIVGDKNVSDKEVDILAYTKDSTLITLNWAILGNKR